MKALSVIVSHVNDNDLCNTLESIRNTAGDAVEIIVVDDCSGTPVEATCPNLALADLVIKNKHRLGVGPSRHIGIRAASAPFVLFCDSHMRFPPGWLDVVLRWVPQYPETIWCATCVGFDKTHMQLSNPAALYHGAHMNWFGADPNDRSKRQVLEAVWNKSAGGGEIGAVMGGAYFCSREKFLQLSVLRFLRIWGSDEVALSLAWWLSGGNCRIVPGLRIGHVFPSKGDRSLWSCPMGPPTYNKLFILHTMLPVDYGNELKQKLESITNKLEWKAATEMAKRDWHIFETERARLQSLFTVPFENYRARFP